VTILLQIVFLCKVLVLTLTEQDGDDLKSGLRAAAHHASFQDALLEGWRCKYLTATALGDQTGVGGEKGAGGVSPPLLHHISN